MKSEPRVRHEDGFPGPLSHGDMFAGLPYLLLVGGSSCAGKTTLCAALSEQYGIRRFSIDDHLGEYALKGRENDLPVCLHQNLLSPEEFWMRDSMVMCEELIGFYREIFPFVMEDLRSAAKEGPLIAEGIALMPELVMKEFPEQTGMAPPQRSEQSDTVYSLHVEYICMVAEESFQVRHYREREWVPLLLDGCRDKKKAFSNWMKREKLFAEYIKQTAEQSGCRLYMIS